MSEPSLVAQYNYYANAKLLEVKQSIYPRIYLEFRNGVAKRRLLELHK